MHTASPVFGSCGIVSFCSIKLFTAVCSVSLLSCSCTIGWAGISKGQHLSLAFSLCWFHSGLPLVDTSICIAFFGEEEGRFPESSASMAPQQSIPHSMKHGYTLSNKIWICLSRVKGAFFLGSSISVKVVGSPYICYSYIIFLSQ